jgi:hypothetical protein
LDDVLLSLDMTHRRPLLGVLTEFFGDWQVFVLTHDRAWYELARQILPQNQWKFAELFAVRVGDYQQPVELDDPGHLARARRFLQEGYVKAAAVHVRTEFELILKRACEELRLKVPYKADSRDLTLGDMWDVVKNVSKDCHICGRIEGGFGGTAGRWKPNRKDEFLLIPELLAERVSLALSWVLNPLSHSETIERYRVEVDDAIDAVGELSIRLDAMITASPWKNRDLFDERQRLVRIVGWGSPAQRSTDR